ncbi:MAG: DUF2125 domain-containing protein [Alphaproteobacteria bacterium]|jgi:hypothetical protein|nr:DUF2125 domain-containing protein [Alphaproteobacteria bacterium]
MRRSRLILAALPVLLIGGYYGLWSYGADQVRTQVDARMAALEAQGGRFEAAELTVSGFPLGFVTEVRNFSLRTPDGVVVRSDAAVAESAVWAPTDIGLSLERGLLVTVPAPQGVAPVRLTAARGSGTLGAAMDGRVHAAELVLETVALDLPGAALVEAESVRLQLAPPPSPAAPLVVAMAARTVDLPGLPAGLLAPTIDHVSLDAAITGPLPPGPSEPALALWRDAGGLVTVERFRLDWGPLSAVASGTVTLDRDLQPEADLTTEIRGFQETLQSLQAAGLLQPTQAALFGVGLTVMAGPPDEEGLATLRAPLSIADRRVTIGGVGVPVRLPRIDWPQRPAF